MKKLCGLFIFILIQSCGSYRLIEKNSDRELLLKQKPNKRLSAKDLNNYPEIHLYDNSALQDVDDDASIVLDGYFTGNDSSRVSLSLNYSQDYEDPTKVQMVDFMWLGRMKGSYKKYWWGLQLKRTVAKYDAIADEATGDTLAAARTTNNQSFTKFGIGLGHRFRALASQFWTDRFFEHITVFGNYIFHQDSTNDEQYTGFGYSADYAIAYRSSEKLFYGPKLSYNWAMVERPDENDESLPQRTLVFGWVTFGFEIGYYF